MTERRWTLVRMLRGQGAISLRELARRVERDVKRVHEDVQELLELDSSSAATAAASSARSARFTLTWSCGRQLERQA